MDVAPGTVAGTVASSVVEICQAGTPARTRKWYACGLRPPVKLTVSVKSMTSGQDTVFAREIWNGVALFPLAPPARLAYAEVPAPIVTPGVDVVRTAEIAVAATVAFSFWSWTVSVPHSPGSTKPSPSPPSSGEGRVTETQERLRRGSDALHGRHRVENARPAVPVDARTASMSIAVDGQDRADLRRRQRRVRT